MRIEYLEEFCQLVATPNLSHVAKERHMSPSALSKHISMLEREFGTTFFLRTTSGLQLTREGSLFYTKISSELDALTSALASARLEFNSSKGRLTIATNRENANGIKRIISNASRKANLELGMNVEVLQQRTPCSIDMLDEGLADFLVLDSSPSFCPKGVDSLELARLGMVCVVDKDSPLAGKPSVSFGEDLWNYPIIKLGSPSFSVGWDRVKSLMEERGIAPTARPLMIDSLADLEFLSHLGGALLLPEDSVESIGDAESAPFAVIPISDSEASFIVRVVWRKDHINADMTRFIDFLKGYLKEVREAVF